MHRGVVEIHWPKANGYIRCDGGCWIETKRFKIWKEYCEEEAAEMVEKIDRFGVIASLRKIQGRFSIAIFDKRERRLWLAVDHMGFSPLYYGRDRRGVFFTGSLRTLKMHRSFPKRIDRASLALFLQYGYILSPWTLLEGVKKVAQGSVVMFDLKERSERLQRYWNPDVFYLQPKYGFDLKEAADTTQRTLLEIIERTISPSDRIGAFLSGGYDSTLLTLLLQRKRDKPIHTYTIGFKERGYNEAPYAEKIADYLGTIHTTHYLLPEELERLFYRMGPSMDEPLGDQALIPSMVVADLAKQDGIQTLVGGDGGDEVFGANSYMGKFSTIATVPRSLRRIVSFLFLLYRILPDKYERLHTQLYRYFRILGARDVTEVLTFKDMLLAPDRMSRLILGEFTPHFTFCETEEVGSESHFSDLLFSKMLQGYVSHDLVAKMRIATGMKRELVALPYLERVFVEHMAHIDFRTKNLYGPKSIQRYLLERYLPETLIERPKRGFSVPMMEWLRNEQRWILDHYLAPGKVEEEGIFDPRTLSRLKERFEKKGAYADGQLLWNLLMFELWYEEWKPFLSDHGVSSHIGAVKDHGVVTSGEVPKQ